MMENNSSFGIAGLLHPGRDLSVHGSGAVAMVAVVAGWTRSWERGHWDTRVILKRCSQVTHRQQRPYSLK